MKKFKVLPLVIAALSLGFASCSSERAIDLQEGGVELSLTTSIQDQSRVTTQTDNANHWDENDAIGVFSTNLGAENVKYTANKAGATTDFVGGSIMIPASATTAQAVQAYYPFTAGTASTINIDLATQNDQPVLWASGTVTYAQPVINLKFAHKLAKLRIKINTEGTEAPTDEVTEISVVEALSQGTLDVVSGKFVAETTKAQLNLIKKGEEYYSYIIPGQKINEIAIKIVHGGKTYNAQLVAEKTADAGKYYLYTIKLNNDKTVQIGEGDANNPINPDESGDEGELIVTPEADTTPEDPATPADPATATLSTDALNAEAAGQTFDLTLDGFEGAVTAEGAPAWVTITGLDATGTTKNLKVTVAENTETTERTATITLKAEGMKDVSFTVTQKGATVSVTEGDGTEANPYTVDQAVENNTGTGVWVQGYILGDTKNGTTLGDGTSDTNILLGNAKTFEESTVVMPIQLPSGTVRTELNVKTNPGNVGKAVKLKGNLEPYFKPTPGMRSVSEYVWVN